MESAAKLHTGLETGEDGFLCDLVGQITSRGVFHGEDPLDFSLPLLLLQLSLISIVTRVFQLILKPLGQPVIVSQILGGVILGPSILGKSSAFIGKIYPKRGRVLLDTLSVFGMMFFIFISGIKVDPKIVLRSGRKALAVGILGFFIPYGLTSLVAFLLQKFSSLDDGISIILPDLTLLPCMTAFPVITCFLDEFKILNSEIGRIASSSSIICDVCLWSIMLVKFVIDMAKTRSVGLTMASFMSYFLFVSFVVFGVRPAAVWAIKRIPEGKRVKESYIVAFLVLLMACGFTAEVIGISAFIVSMFLGLVIPDGPPLGAALVDRLDCFFSVLFLPPFFATCGLNMDIYSIQKLKNVGVFQLVVLVGFIGKILGTMLPLLFYRMPFRDALSLGLIMNSKGILELAIISDYRRVHELTEECYAMLVLSVLIVTGVVSPIVKVLYDPSKRILAYKRRTILHSRRNDELRILACVHGQENVPGMFSLLEVSNPTKESSIHLVVLHLIKLTGRATSLLVAQRQHDEPSSNPCLSDRIFNSFRQFEEQNQSFVTVQCYKGISPYATMHNDVCSLALETRTILILLPFHKLWRSRERIESSYAYRHLNKYTLDKAPCSVGVLIDRGNLRRSRYAIIRPSINRVAVLFLGGADDREALAYATRMVENSNVTLTVIRCVSSSPVGIVGGTERSKMLDAAILGDVKVKMQRGERILYQEQVVTSGMDVVSLTRSSGDCFDLIMVGRRHVDSPIVLQLRNFNEEGEMGVLGQILASENFRGEASGLIIQQQTKLWGLKDPEDSTHLRRIN